MSSCPHTQDNLNWHLEGAFTNIEEQALREHLTTCPACAAAFKQMNLLEEVVRDAVMPETDTQKAAARVTDRLAQQEVTPAQDFEEAFLAYCSKIAQVAPLAATQTKLQVTQVGLPEDLAELLRNELRYTGKGLASSDGKEARKAIFEKRKPQFSGS